MSDCAYRANPDQVIAQTSWILRINVIFSTTLGFGTIISTFACVHYMRKHPIFHNSTKILLYFALFFANLHDVTYVLSKWAVFYRSFYYADDPCYLMFSIDECYPFARFLFLGVIGVIYIHSALTLDGVLAFFLPYHYYKYEKIPGYVLIVLLLLIAVLIQEIVIPFGFESDEVLPSCQFFPGMFSGRANIFLLTSLGVTILNFLINISLLRVHKKQGRRSETPNIIEKYSYNEYSRMSFDVVDKYNRHEAMMTSKAVSLLVIAQISALALYEGGTFTFRMFKSQIHASIYSNLAIWAYALSYATFSLPLLIIFCIKYVRKNRRVSIHNMTTHKENMENRMNELRMMWS